MFRRVAPDYKKKETAEAQRKKTITAYGALWPIFPYAEVDFTWFRIRGSIRQVLPHCGLFFEALICVT